MRGQGGRAGHSAGRAGGAKLAIAVGEGGALVIVGSGIDVVEIARIERALDRHGERFCQRVFTPREIRTCAARGRSAIQFALRFAAKEAVMKALGTGMAGAGFTEIRIYHHDGGQPYVVLGGSAQVRAEELGIASWHVSITHSKTTAGAVAIAMR